MLATSASVRPGDGWRGGVNEMEGRGCKVQMETIETLFRRIHKVFCKFSNQSKIKDIV